jgi:hypothetical protein
MDTAVHITYDGDMVRIRNAIIPRSIRRGNYTTIERVLVCSCHSVIVLKVKPGGSEPCSQANPIEKKQYHIRVVCKLLPHIEIQH